MKYEIKGTPFPVVECRIERGETMITEGGGMVWMTPQIEMTTSGQGGFARLFSGENIFRNLYTANADNQLIAFGSSFPGRILPIDVTNKAWIMQKSAFLASEDTVNYEVVFQKKFSSGLFGGEGFIMQRLSGRGIVFVEIDGELIEYQLAAGQQIVVDTGNVAGYEETVQMDIQSVKGIKNKLFGGEGLFNTVLTGPGKILLQTMPVSGMAQILIPYMPTSSNN
ncbi:MAG: TIGR00266 family protein [Erysipelotrichaceae bacterium]|jgi:uncharacterized protein (TIGR00266 family)|nr:TIGR00266 family protein [Erysipelotrichaceae bacterium]MDO5108829.1 TIGR00266 family protein [Erysipelotrichaceae bacterium]